MSVEIAWGRQRDRVRTTQAADHRMTLCWLARYAVVVCLSVRLKPVLHRNESINNRLIHKMT